ncbi:IS110 family transposase [Chitinophaga sp. LS1]|uniref:IS110 family transposase n=1 Tax=Chitinophaga sp. LS1 TaxID=3051176 RepID=UPI002AAB4B49|nr:IS110 family transposase [Chitinophaga sp. LS1]WPV63902.1 IS110 family transposase [Chitinophaga sp. LS1]WPV68254.1 IS110 family transposase [Chitinophaga sp. LS1]WPV68258.1 IS110 family transposase [Chitinophaga sp. LS1]
MPKVKQLNFEGQTIFCGIDVHKKTWRVNIRNDEFELEDYSQEASVEQLVNHLQKKYPGASYQVAYEAGFCGFSIHRFLSKLGVNCIVANPADVPSTDKEKRRKNDKIDARKISRHLSKTELPPIYVPDLEAEHARTLVRQRGRLVQDQTRCKNRIWHLLMFSGLKLDVDKPQQYWSRKFIATLQSLSCQTESLKMALNIALEEYLLVRKLLSVATKQIRTLSIHPNYTAVQKLLQSIPGIGIVNAMIIMAELQDMNRFKTLDKLCSYVGIVPDTGSSGENDVIKGITQRGNHYLRPAIVESSWVIIRKDPAMLMLYKKYCSTMIPNKAIIKIARHLLSRIRHVWRNQVEYEIGIVG